MDYRNLEDSSLPIKILHKCCNKQARILPKKVKDEAEIENEGLFFTKEPEDANSHGVVLREHKKEKDDDDDQDEKDTIAISIEEWSEIKAWCISKQRLYPNTYNCSNNFH